MSERPKGPIYQPVAAEAAPADVDDLFPPVQPHIVPEHELNLRGTREWSPTDRFEARTVVPGADPNLDPHAAHTRTVNVPPQRLPYQEDPRVAQVEREQRAVGAAAVAREPRRQAPVEPATGRPMTPADYFRQEVVPEILAGRGPNNGRGL